MQRFTRPLILGLGAQKSGTTWLSAKLREYTNAWVSPLKELHYFDRYSDLKSIQGQYRKHHYDKLRHTISNQYNLTPSKREYLIQLVDRCTIETDEDYVMFLRRYAPNGAPAAADITPEYASLSPEGFKKVCEIAPNSLPVFIMRDPVDRIWSMAKHVAKYDKKTQALSSLDNLLAFARGDYVRRLTDYQKTIRSMRGAFRNPIIVYYEDVFSSTTAATEFIRSISKRANLDMNPNPKNILETVYSGLTDTLDEKWRSALREDLNEIYEGVKESHTALPKKWEE